MYVIDIRTNHVKSGDDVADLCLLLRLQLIILLVEIEVAVRHSIISGITAAIKANLTSILSYYGESVSSMFDLRTAITGSHLLVTL